MGQTMETVEIKPTYIRLLKDAPVQVVGKPLAIIDALRKAEGKATYQQLRKSTQFSLSALYSLIKQLKIAQIVEVVNPTVKQLQAIEITSAAVDPQDPQTTAAAELASDGNGHSNSTNGTFEIAPDSKDMPDAKDTPVESEGAGCAD